MWHYHFHHHHHYHVPTPPVYRSFFCSPGQLDELGSHLSSLVQLLKIGLEDARDAFNSFGQSKALSAGDKVDESMSNHGTHLLDVHAEAIRLDSRINTDFVRFIQAFLER